MINVSTCSPDPERRSHLLQQMNAAIFFRTGLPIAWFAMVCFQLTVSEWFLLYRLPMSPPSSSRGNSSMKIAIAALQRGAKYEKDFVAYCAHARVKKYAELRGYTVFDQHHYPSDDAMLPYREWMRNAKRMRFDKLRFLIWMAEASEADWILWIDADALPTDFSVRVEDRIAWFEEMRSGDAELLFVIGSNHQGINSGVFLLRNSYEGRQMLRRFYDTYVDPTETWADQLSIILSLQQDDRIRRATLVLAGTITYLLQSSPGYIWNGNQWRPSDFILHCPHISPADKRFVKHYLCRGEFAPQSSQLVRSPPS